MIEAKLVTRSGDAVVTLLIPPFQNKQDLVLQWGDRFFRYDTGRWVEQTLYVCPPDVEQV